MTQPANRRLVTEDRFLVTEAEAAAAYDAVNSIASLSPNYIINGAFDIWQRGTSFVNPSSTTSFTADRFFHYRGSLVTGMTTSRQSSGLTGIQYCARVQRAASNTSTESLNLLANTIETANAIQLAGKSVTLSFYARSGANFSASGSVLTPTTTSGTGTDQNPFSWTGGTTVATGSAVLTTSWQRFTFTGTVPSNCSELYTSFSYTPVGTAGANDYFEITGVQLEVGAVATAFRRNAPSIQGELAACQRYYQVDAVQTYLNATSAGLSNSYVGSKAFLMEMRTTPTLTIYPADNLSGVAGKATMYPPGTAQTMNVEVLTNKHFQIMYPGISTYNLAIFTWKAEAEL